MKNSRIIKFLYRKQKKLPKRELLHFEDPQGKRNKEGSDAQYIHL